jgi:hypothetical protein
MANNEKITIFFEPKGDKKLVKAINSLSRAQGRLSKSTENVNRTNQRNSKSSDKSSASMMALGGTMSVVRSKLLVYGFATGLATKVTQVFTSAAMKQEEVEKKLAVQLGFVSNRLLEYASAQQKVTRFGDEDVISVMGQISAFSKNEEQIESLTKATLDLSEGMGIGLNEAALLIGKTFGSSTNALSRYGIQVKGAVGSQSRLESLTGSVAMKYGDLSQNIDTTSKAIQQMNNAMGDALEEIGKSFLPSMKKTAIDMTKTVHEKVIPSIKVLQSIDFGATATNFVNNGQVIIDFLIELSGLFPKVALLIGQKFAKTMLDVLDRFSTTVATFFGSLSGELGSLVFHVFKGIGMEMGKGIMEGWNWFHSMFLGSAGDMLGLTKFTDESFEGVQQSIDKNKTKIGNNRLFGLFKDTFNQDITDTESAIKAFVDTFKGTIGELMVFQEEAAKDPGGGGGEEQKGFFARLFSMTDEEKETFRENWQMFQDGVMGVAEAYDTLKMQQIDQARQAELDATKGIRSERVRQKKMDEINKKYDAKVKKQKEKMRTIKIAEAISNTALGITKAYSDPGGTAGLIMAALIGIQGALQIATIRGQKYQYGGLVGGNRHSQGGTMIEAERGEYVVSRRGVDAMGVEALNRINAGAGSGGVNITFSSNILSKDFIEDEAIPQIKSAIERGADIGVG